MHDHAEAQAAHHRQVMEQLKTAEEKPRELHRNILTEERDREGYSCEARDEFDPRT